MICWGREGVLWLLKRYVYLLFYIRWVLCKAVRGDELVEANTPKLVGKLGVSVAEAIFIFDCDVPGYTEIVKGRLGDLKRYAMVTLTESNIGTPIN